VTAVGPWSILAVFALLVVGAVVIARRKAAR
jgi:uncharacterized protein (TIGR03382 family)